MQENGSEQSTPVTRTNFHYPIMHYVFVSKRFWNTVAATRPTRIVSRNEIPIH